jgi:hypothetical protein
MPLPMRNASNSELRRWGSLRPPDAQTPIHEHAVHFYESDEALVDTVREFLVTGLEVGEPCIVIGTDSHREAFCLALATHGVDVELARASGRLILVGARETLERIVVNGAVDNTTFHREARSIMDRALSQGRTGRIRLYGEMVDLLWARGHRSAAIQLEGLWNDLASEYDYSLLCGYVFGNFCRSTDTEGFEQICRLHTHIVEENAHLADCGEALVELALLRQRASSLENEVRQRRELEETLRKALADQECTEAALRENRRANLERTERLLKISAAIADAVTEKEVLDAVVDQTAAALGASSIGLWTTDLEGRKALLLRCFGYPDGARTRFSEVPLDASARFPSLDVLCSGKPIFIASQEELLERYPHLATAVTHGRSYCLACLPITVEGSRPGSMLFSFDNAPPVDEEQRKLLTLVARYSGQALARLQLLERS